jgi:hypothetical protein
MILVFHYRKMWLYGWMLDAQRLFKPGISRMRSEQILKHHTGGTARCEEGRLAAGEISDGAATGEVLSKKVQAGIA